jgi:hypothetical protein
MKALNISVYEPFPAEAIERAERDRRGRRNGRGDATEHPPVP